MRQEKGSILIPELLKIFPDEKVVLERDFSTKVRVVKKNDDKHSLKNRGSTRVVMGRYRTTEEYEERRTRILNNQMP